MIPGDLTSLIAAIHDGPHRLVYEFAGAGSLALAWLHLVPGSSRTVLEATDRYSAPSLGALLQPPPASVVSKETAEAMATAALVRAATLSSTGPVLGVACTAALVTDRHRRGSDRAFVSIVGDAGPTTIALDLAGDRHAQEEAVSRAVVAAIATAAGVS